VYKPSATATAKKRSFAKISSANVNLQDIIRIPLSDVKPALQVGFKNAPLDRSRFAIENLFRPVRSSPETYVGLNRRLIALESLNRLEARDLNTKLQHALIFATSAEWTIAIEQVKLKHWPHKDELALQRMLLPVFCWLQKLNKRASYVLTELKSILHEFGIFQSREDHVAEGRFVLHFSCFSADGLQTFDFFSLVVTMS
jgi:hypothetical protein